jgi:signal peptidase I
MPSTFFRTFVFVSVVVGLLVLVLRLTCLRWWQVPQDDPDLAASMAPTLAAGDWLILWRATPPGFGDLVLCPDPEDPAEVFVGRIAAEGSDTLSVDERGSLTVNEVRMKSEHACDPHLFVVAHPRTGDEIEMRCDIEALGGVRHSRALVPENAPLKPGILNKRPVEPGSVYLISDNRLFPFDSRDFGPLPQASCKERIAFRLVSRLGFSDVKHRLSWIP